MKPLELDSDDQEEIRNLGRASVQIVHDLKNQLNGLKLYATFLRKRMERSDRPADEIETVMKLIGGIERAAADMNVLVRYGRRLDIRLQPGADLVRILQQAFKTTTLRFEEVEEQFSGSFDAEALIEAFTAIADSLCKPDEVRVRLIDDKTGGGGRSAHIEWEPPVGASNGIDPFQSFAGGSSGLRLALAAKIIRAHGGQATRTAADGSMLRVVLPLREAEEK